MKTTWVAFVGLMAMACGGDGDPVDAGRIDAGAGEDAGPSSDAGGDAGRDDAGGAADAGRDAGSDAGPPCGPFVACAPDPTVTDDDGNVYATVQICGQCWMAENLRVGMDFIIDPPGMPADQFQTNDGTVQRYCPRNRSSGCDELGGLYQWNELMAYGAGPGGICPSGWHVPSDEEWKTLERALGMSAADADRRSSSMARGTDEGTELQPGGRASFDAPLAGFGAEMFGHYDISAPGSIGRYWTSTSTGGNAWFRSLSMGTTGVFRDFETADHGYSARCLRD